MSNANGSAATCQQPHSDFPQKKKTCRQLVRVLPIERFRLAGDGRKWKDLARRRAQFLEFLATWSEDNGTFYKWKNGAIANYSPSEQRLTQRYGRSNFYRLTEDLHALGLLHWVREEKPHGHFGRRVYRITADRPHPDTLTPPPRWPLKHCFLAPEEWKQWSIDIAEWEKVSGRHAMVEEIEPIGPKELSGYLDIEPCSFTDSDGRKHYVEHGQYGYPDIADHVHDSSPPSP
jgi:hypothetical protein